MESIETIKEGDFLDFYNSRSYSANCFNSDGSLNKNYNSFKSTGIIATIFEDHWDKTYSDNKEIIDKFPFENRINLLFKAVNKTIYSILNEHFKKNKKGFLKKYSSKTKYTPGFFAFLHTFGRDLKWNPHIHILIAEIKLSDKDTCSPWNFFDYDALSMRFQKFYLTYYQKNLAVLLIKRKNLFIVLILRGFMFMLNLKSSKI